MEKEEEYHLLHIPTLELASVKLFNVVDLPDEGFPTNPIKGSRGILRVCWVIGVPLKFSGTLKLCDKKSSQASWVYLSTPMAN